MYGTVLNYNYLTLSFHLRAYLELGATWDIKDRYRNIDKLYRINMNCSFLIYLLWIKMSSCSCTTRSDMSQLMDVESVKTFTETNDLSFNGYAIWSFCKGYIASYPTFSCWIEQVDNGLILQLRKIVLKIWKI